MLPLLLGALAGGLLFKNMTGYPSEIRNLQRQMPKDEREDFTRDYKSLSGETKTQFKKYLREANLVEAGRLIGKDLSGYAATVAKNAKQAEQKIEANAVGSENGDIISTGDNAFTERIKNILNAAQFDFDPQLVTEAAKCYDKISDCNQLNMMDKTRKMLDVSQ